MWGRVEGRSLDFKLASSCLERFFGLQPMENQRPSMRDIARRLNVSHATVSMALRDNPRISEKRRAEVRKVAEEIGYVPDPMLSSLVAYRQGKHSKPVVSTLAWVNRWENPEELRSFKEFDSYWRGAASSAENLGYRLEEFRVNDEMKGKRLNDILLARGIQGILVPPHVESGNLMDVGLEWDKFSVVRFGFSITGFRADMIGSDQMRSSELAIDRMTAAGYRSIGLVTNKGFDRKTDGNFRMGYLRGMELAESAQFIPPLVLEDGIPTATPDEKTVAELQDWLGKYKPDAILTSEMGLAPKLKNLGYRIPEDFALASTSIREGEGITAGIDQNPFEIGAVASQVLVGRINRNAKGEPEYCRRVLVEADWTYGPSLPAVKP